MQKTYPTLVEVLTLTLQTWYRPKPLNSHQSTPSAPVLVAGMTSRTVKYASTYPRLREATSGAPWRVFPRHRFATLGLTLTRQTCTGQNR
jgi:hypothetical protein